MPLYLNCDKMRPEKWKPEELVKSLASRGDDQLGALKMIKNSVIGNRRQKQSYVKLGAVQIMLDILSTEQDPSILVQAAQAIGSFASADDGARAVLVNGGVPKLLKALNNSDERVVEASLRALKLLYKVSTFPQRMATGTSQESRLSTTSASIFYRIFHLAFKSINLSASFFSKSILLPMLQGTDAPADAFFGTPGALAKVISLLSAPNPHLQEGAAAMITNCCANPAQQAAFLSAGAVPPLVSLLLDSHRTRQVAALDALAALCANNAAASAEVLETGRHALPLLLSFAKQAPAPRTRFLACSCLTHLARQLDKQGKGAAARNGAASPGPSAEDVEHSVLPVLVRLLSEPTVGSEAAPAIMALTDGKEDLMRAAADADAVSRLASLLKEPEEGPKGRAAALMTLGMLCADNEEYRRQLVDAAGLPYVAEALRDVHPGVRGAASCCMHSLSRSTRLLRRTLGTLGDVAGPLLTLSRDQDQSVAEEATATLANMSVEYSAVKDQLLKHGGVERFAELATSAQGRLRLHGIWGLSSVAYMSSPEVKASIMRHLPWGSAAALLADDDAEVREKALLLLRNLVYNASSDVEAALAWSKGALLSTILAAAQRADEGAHQLQHALYAVVNVASGNAACKRAVMEAGWAPTLRTFLTHESERVREAAVWAVINLVWRRDGDGGSGSEGDPVETSIVAQMDDLGIEQRLMALTSDSCMIVRERATTALVHFHERGSGQGEDEEVAGAAEEERLLATLPVPGADFGFDSEEEIEEDEDDEEDDEEMPDVDGAAW